MQEKKNTIRTFLERTDCLAEKMKVSLRELAPIMGLSVASLFGYRSGALAVSNKAWRKLEGAEQEAGINHVTRDVISEVTKEKLLHVEQLSDNQLTRELISQREKFTALEEKVEEMKGMLERVLEELAEQREREKVSASSSLDHGREARKGNKKTA